MAHLHPPLGCFLLPDFCLAVEIAARPELKDLPLALTQNGHAEIWLASPSAQRQGVVPGQPLRQALAICPSLQVLDSRSAKYADEMDKVVVQLHEVLFAIEPRPIEEGVIYFAISGQEHATNLIARILSCAPKELRPRLGLSVNKFMARIAAEQASPLCCHAIAAEDIPNCLAEQAIELLPISQETFRRLSLLGLRKLGQISSLPQAALISAFGVSEGERIWQLANGQDTASLQIYSPAEPVRAQMTLDAPIGTNEQLLACLEQLIGQLCSSPAFMHRSARQAQMRLITERGSCKEIEVNFHDPVSDIQDLYRLLSRPLRGINAPGPVVEIKLQLSGIATAQGWQRNFAHTHGGRKELLQDGLRKLRTQYGHCPVSQIVPIDPDNRIPENRWALIDCNL